MVPTGLHFKNGWAKLGLALARGRKNYDKRRKEGEKDARRQMERGLKGSP